MLKVKEIAFSCYPVLDMKRSRAFYEGILGLSPAMVSEREGAQWVEYEVGASTLTLGVAPGWKPSTEGANVALEVEDFESAIAHLRAENIEFAMEPLETPVCHMAIIADPDGSRLVIHQRKSTQPAPIPSPS